jgi:peptidoglycan/LPS O-acetylase OafA/YrhL
VRSEVGVRPGEIKALTGLRFVAALWVAVFHLTLVLLHTAPWGSVRFQPTLRYGYLGVDLFFVLSGYVLALNYTDRIGQRFSWRPTLKFWWLRLARIWPVYFVTLNLAGLVLLYRERVGLPAPWGAELSVSSYFEQLVMVQLWTRPSLDGASWDEPAWSISAEWLAYLVFPLVILLVWRLRWRTRVRTLTLLAAAVTLPCAALMFSTGQFYSPYSWLPRILLQFLAGAIAYAAVARCVLTERMCRAVGWIATGLVVVIVSVMLLVEENTELTNIAVYLRVLFVPLVMAVAVGSTGLPKLLTARPLVIGGHLSYSFYLVHALVFQVVIVGAHDLGLLPTDKNGRWAELGVIMLAASILAAYVLWRWVEEPSRKAMRALWSGRPRTVTRTAETAPAPIRV